MIKLCKCCQDQEISMENEKGLCSGCYSYLEEDNRLNDYDDEEDIFVDWES